MWRVLERLQSEHRNFFRLANLLEERARHVPLPQHSDFELIQFPAAACKLDVNERFSDGGLKQRAQ